MARPTRSPAAEPQLRVRPSRRASCSGRRPSVWAGSKKLRLSQPLAGQGVRPLSLLTVTGRLAGGGGDGGSTGAECRTAYLEMYKRKTVGALDAAQEALARWTRCSLSGEPLSEPVVADELGSLYNKEAVVRGLVEQLADGPKLPPHLTLKTIIDLKLARCVTVRRSNALAVARLVVGPACMRSPISYLESQEPGVCGRWRRVSGRVALLLPHHGGRVHEQEPLCRRPQDGSRGCREGVQGEAYWK